jgi:hypothetical protein
MKTYIATTYDAVWKRNVILLREMKKIWIMSYVRKYIDFAQNFPYLQIIVPFHGTGLKVILLIPLRKLQLSVHQFYAINKY